MPIDDAQYRTVLNTVEDAIYMTDDSRRFTWINSATERLFGYDRDAIIGTHLFEFLDDDQIETATANLRSLRSADTPDTITFEMEIPTKDGSTIPTETHATLLPGEGFSGTAGVIRDISERTERKRLSNGRTNASTGLRGSSPTTSEIPSPWPRGDSSWPARTVTAIISTPSRTPTSAWPPSSMTSPPSREPTSH